MSNSGWHLPILALCTKYVTHCCVKGDAKQGQEHKANPACISVRTYKAALLDPLICGIDPCDQHKKVMGACRLYSDVVLLRRLHQHVDFVVCLGGDGTILHASSLFQRAIPPVISFSAGSLGFLTNHSLQNVESDLRAVIYGSEDLNECSLEEEVWLDRTDTQSALNTCFSTESSASLVEHRCMANGYLCPGMQRSYFGYADAGRAYNPAHAAGMQDHPAAASTGTEQQQQ